MYFPSKKDWWMSCLIWGVGIAVLIDGIFVMGWGVFVVPFIQDHYFIRLAALAFFAAFILSIWFRTGYYLTDQTLTIYYGPFKKKINVKEIHSIRFVKMPFIAPALSIQQVQIKYSKRKTIRISPRDPEVFAQFLKVRSGLTVKISQKA